MDDFETKRAQARQHRGVTFDPRLGKFTAEITLYGERVYLGSFATAQAAAAAYQEQRDAVPVTRRRNGRTPLHAAYAAFLVNCKKDERGDPEIGEIFTAPDGQRFRLETVERARKDGAYMVWSIWGSRCRVCGAHYVFSLNRRVQNVKWILRNCEEHRGYTADEPQVWPDPPAWSKPFAESEIAQQREANRAEAKAARDADNRPEIIPGPVLPGDGRFDNFRRAGRAAGYNNDEIVERLKVHVVKVYRDSLKDLI